MKKYYLRSLFFNKEYKLYRDKFFIKLGLIFWTGIQRVLFLLSGMIGAIVLSQIIRERFIFNYFGFVKIIAYIIFEIDAILIYNYRNKFVKNQNYYGIISMKL